jgi:hypothetical protein
MRNVRPRSARLPLDEFARERQVLLTRLLRRVTQEVAPEADVRPLSEAFQRAPQPGPPAILLARVLSAQDGAQAVQVSRLPYALLVPPVAQPEVLLDPLLQPRAATHATSRCR